MKANITRSWYKLPKPERDSLQKAMTEQVYNLVDKEEQEMQVVWIKLACIILHDVYGIGEKRLLRFIAAWKRMYRRHARFNDDKHDRDEWLASEMARCFPKGGFPDERIEEMKNM